VSEPGKSWLLAGVLANSDRMADPLPEFHRRALGAAGGTASVLLRLNHRTGHLHVDSGSGLDHIESAPWLDDPEARSAIDRAWTEAKPIVVCGLRDVTCRLHAPIALLAPLGAQKQRLGVLLVATEDRSRAEAAREEVGAIAGLMSLTLERAKLQRDAQLQRDLRALAADLSGAVSSSVQLNASLEIFCDKAARLFAADRVSVWLHDRRARALDLVASSDSAELAAERRVATEDYTIAVSFAMRRSEAVVMPSAEDHPPDVLVPLRGRRRALGTLELCGVRIDPGDGIDLLDRVEEIARQVSASIENVWLLEEVLRSRRELESTFNSLTDLVIVADANLHVTQANRAFASRVGRQAEHIVSQPLTDFFGRDVINWIERRGRDGQGIGAADESREIADEKLQGTFLFTLSMLARANARIGTVIVARDVTGQARLEAERAELRDRLTQSEKLAALGQFVAGIAHELNNPLQGVLGHVELMLHDRGGANPFRHELKLVFREADRAAKIVHNLLVFAGSRRITRRRLNANNVVERVLALRATACAAASITIVKDLAPKLPRVAGDALLLQQALLNIVMNAEQAMAGSSAPRMLEVRTRAVRRHRVEIEIADSGPGIAHDALPRLFEPFFTTKEVGQGTGLGLAIAYGVVQEHGGQLQASNRTNGGAIFTLALPAGLAEAVE
jgi:C4-dicarboxylate-specific signal transduction histidine kinase